MSTSPSQAAPGGRFYAVLIGGVAVIAMVLAFSTFSGHRGSKDSPTAAVNGQNIVGKTASD